MCPYAHVVRIQPPQVLMMKMHTSSSYHHALLCCSQMMERELCVRQLRYSGMMETIRIRKAGYPIRHTFSGFIDRYQYLVPQLLIKYPDEKQACKVVCQQVLGSKSDFQIGVTKIFLKVCNVCVSICVCPYVCVGVWVCVCLLCPYACVCGCVCVCTCVQNMYINNACVVHTFVCVSVIYMYQLLHVCVHCFFP